MTEAEIQDIRLMQRVASGDRDAYGRLFDRHAPMLLGILMRIVGSREDGEEVLQESFLQVWYQADRYDPRRASPAGWMVMMARSRAIDRIRSETSRSQRTQHFAFDVTPSFPTPGTGRLEADERRARILRALAELPPLQRECLELAFYEGLSHSQIAATVGAPLGTVKSRIVSAMHKLRDLLGSSSPSPEAV